MQLKNNKKTKQLLDCTGEKESLNGYKQGFSLACGWWFFWLV